MQARQSISINANDTNITHSHQMEQVIPPSRIASLSSGEFVGMVADTPDDPIELKMFCSHIINDHEALKEEEDSFVDLPVINNVTSDLVHANYTQVKQDVTDIVYSEIERMRNTDYLKALVLK